MYFRAFLYILLFTCVRLLHYSHFIHLPVRLIPTLRRSVLAHISQRASYLLAFFFTHFFHSFSFNLNDNFVFERKKKHFPTFVKKSRYFWSVQIFFYFEQVSRALFLNRDILRSAGILGWGSRFFMVFIIAIVIILTFMHMFINILIVEKLIWLCYSLFVQP